jgi:hypothetical protein
MLWLVGGNRVELVSVSVSKLGCRALQYSYARGFRAHWVSAHSNLERLVTDSIGFSVLKRALR